MALLNSTSRRFARTRQYSHEQRSNRIAQVRERIELASPERRPSRRTEEGPEAPRV